jgi:hypothetical protein
MTVPEIASADIISFDDLRLLAAGKDLCTTIVAATPNADGMRTRLKNAIRQVEKQLANRGVDRNTTAALVETVDSIATTVEAEGRWANGLILFRSPDMFRYFWLRELPKEIVAVTKRFQIRPLLSVLSREQRFYILVLSQQHTCLFRCTPHSAEKVNLGGVVPDSLPVRMQTRRPDHILDNWAAAGPSVGKGVMFGTSTDREREDQYLAHFFKEVDKGIHSILRNDTAALILAGVKYEVALYRKVSIHSRLLEKAIHRSPDKLTPQDLHQHAWEIVMESFSQSLRKALTDFETLRDTERVSFSQNAIIKGAFEGRVANLFLSEGSEHNGVWNEEMHEVEPQIRDNRSEELLNAAALQTVLHRGRAFALRPHEMPQRVEALAVFRFGNTRQSRAVYT